MSIIIVVSLIGIYYFSNAYIIKPLKIEAEIVGNEVSVYQAQIEEIEKQDSDDIPDALSEIALQIPDGKSPDDVLAMIHQLGQASKVTVQSIESLGSSEGEQEYTEDEDVETEPKTSAIRTMYSLEITANKLAQIDAFLDQMILAERLLIIDTLEVDHASDESVAQITFSAYHINP